MQPRSHGVRRDAECRAGVRVREIVQIAEDDDLPKCDGYASEGAAYLPTCLLCRHLLERIRARRLVWLRQIGRPEKQESTLPAETIPAHVPDNAVKIGTQRCPLRVIPLQLL